MEKMEPTIKELSASSEFSGVFEEKEVQDVSREDIAEMCNESFLLRGHTVSTLEKYLKKARSAEDFHFVVDAIEYLEKRAENEPYHELEKDDLMPFLESIAQKDISYFVRENARVNLRVPLESSSVRYKRKLLQLEFENIRQEGVAIELFGQNDVRSPADIDALDDAIVLRAFRIYGEMNPAYYRWNEWMSLQQRFHEESLDRWYDISGDHERALYDDIWSIQHERRRREQSILSRISDRFGVLYDASGSVESFFELDEKAEKREKLKEEIFGKISESHLEYFIDFFSSSERSNEEKMLRYIQIRPRLPKTFIEDFERRFPVFIPDQLQKDFRTQDDFEDESESFYKSILLSVSKEGQVKMMEDLVSRLSKLLYEGQEVDRKENFGVASEDAENLLDFSLSNIALDPEDTKPTAHHSICYYLFLRNKLPLEMVNEFETRFDLKIPNRLKGFVSYDRYLKINDRELITAINSGNASLEEMREWLLENIGTLKEKIQSKKVLTKKLSFQELLKQEGLESDLLEEKNFEARYRFLLHPVFRKKIEDDFGIELKDFSVRVQVQFLNFLFEKNEEEVKRVIAFLKNGDATNRLKSFLSLEQGGADMGEKILAIGEKLPKEAADRVFAKYAEMADASREEAKKIYEKYKKTFSPDSITEEKIAGALIASANTLIRDMSEALESEGSLESRNELADSLVESLEKNHIARERILGEFLAVSESLVTLVANLEKEYISLPGAFSSPENQEGFIQESLEEGEKFLTEKYGPEALQELKRKNQEMKEGERLHQDEVIQDIIQEIEREYANTQEMLAILQQHDIAQNTAEKLRKSTEENARKFQPITKKLVEVLKQRGRMKKKFDEMLYGRESATLPRGFFDGVSDAMRNIHAEIPETSKRVYFPVGISKELPKWESVLAGKGKSAKPIDLYNFLFWLNAQGKESGKPIFLPVADETQAWNFEMLYGKTRDEALEAARAIGKAEGERYQTIVRTFGLEFVRVVSYKEFFLDTEEKTKKFEQYRTLLTRISTTSNWVGAFENMVGDSVSGKQTESSTTKEEKEKLFPYAIEEIALLLTERGMKVSHPKEARYDVVAAALENLERYAKEKNIDFFDPDQYDRLRPALRSILKALGDRLNNPSKEARSVSGRAYIKAAQTALKRIQLEKGGSIFTKQEEKTVVFDFHPASPDSRSFGWRSAGEKGEEERLTFKEPYSTYFPAGESSVFLEDQVVAVPEGIIAGKILTLSAEKQNEYVEAVVKPLLAHYFASLKSAPQSYFHSVGKTENALVEICQKSETLGDLLAFIQKYIVAPSVRGANEVSPNEG